jgi:hypothetical protein
MTMTRTSRQPVDRDRDYYESDVDDRDYDDRDYDDRLGKDRNYYADLHHDARSRGNYRRRKISFLNSIPLDWLIAAGSVCVIAQSTICSGNSYTTFLLGAAWLGFCAVVIGYSDNGLNAAESGYKKFLKKYGSTGIWGVVFGVVALTALFFALAEPSQAQFLLTTEATVKKLFTTKGSGASNGAVSTGTDVGALTSALGTVFTGLRGVLIMALLYAAYKMFMARDDQEDLKMQARMPILLLVITTITDVTAGAIAGGP